MKIIGEFIERNIIVKKPKDVGKLFNKSHFGKTISGNKLQLDLLEGVFLLGERKLTVFHEGKEIDFQHLVTIAAKHIPRFEINYLTFRDLRKRGYAVKLERKYKGFDLIIDLQKKDGKRRFISSYSERDIMDIDETKHLIEAAVKHKADLWFALVDEEGDITYYDVTMLDVKGNTRKHVFSKDTGILLENRVVIFDGKLANALLEKEFFGKSFGNGLQLSMVEALYLMENDVVDIRDFVTGKKLSLKTFKTIIHKSQPDIELRLLVFRDLKRRGLIVKTGFKFGAHFRAYTKKPDKIHAEYLVHVVNKGFKSTWAEIGRAVRLAHSVNKEIVFARVCDDEIDYIKFGRLRP